MITIAPGQNVLESSLSTRLERLSVLTAGQGILYMNTKQKHKLQHNKQNKQQLKQQHKQC